MANAIGTDSAESDAIEVKKVNFPTLTAMVVGGMVGAGVFALPARFGVAAGVLGALTGWVITGVGWLMLAFVFQNLAVLKPNLDAGIFAYAKAGFGDYIGFNSAWGFWAGGNLSKTFFWVIMLRTVGRAVPALHGGNTVLAIAISSVGVWAFAYLIARGVSGAAIINRIVTVAKMIPIVVFIVVVGVSAFTAHGGQFHLNLWGSAQPSAHTLFSQANGTLLIAAFAFKGIESAVVNSRYAQRREHVGRATVLGFLGVLCIYALVTMVAYGVLPRDQLAMAHQPSVGTVMEHVVGHWGYVFISVGLVVSVLGVYLVANLVAVEILFIPATSRDMPRFLARQNHAQVPIRAVIMTSAAVQIFLIVAGFSENALDFLLDLSVCVALVPYLLSAAYALKVAVTRDGYPEGASVARHLGIAALGTIFALYMFYVAGVKFILFACIIYALGTVLYVKARRETQQRTFLAYEAGLCVLLILTGLAGLVGLATGQLTV